MKILANDGISPSGKAALESKGFEVLTTFVAQDHLADFIKNNQIEVLIVRSATQVRKDLLDATDLKIVGRGGVGMDNIDVEYARSKGIQVFNTPSASSPSVAEMVMAHVYSLYRNLHQSNRAMPLEGESRFKDLKKSYEIAHELRGKTMGIIGFGRIGQEVAKAAIGAGMRVICRTSSSPINKVELEFFDGQKLAFDIERFDLKELLTESDVVTIHVPATGKYILGKEEIALLKPNAIVVNTARGGVVDEKALLEALDSEKLLGAALDVFEDEPSPSIQLLMNDKLSLSPHLAGSTVVAQDRIGQELAEQIIEFYKK